MVKREVLVGQVLTVETGDAKIPRSVTNLNHFYHGEKRLMTKKTFMRKFREIQNKFYWNIEGSQLRGYLKGSHNNIEYCPLTAMAKVTTGQVFSTHQFHEAARALNFTGNTGEIVSAADNKLKYTGNPQLRRSLLKAVGLPVV